MKRLDLDILCIGGGAAGMIAALSAAQEDVRVCLVVKEPIGYGNTRISGGIVANPGYFPADSAELFVQDMMLAGGNLNNEQLIEILAKEGSMINQLMEQWGQTYQRDDQGEIGASVAIGVGGHSVPRTLCSSFQGVSLSNALRAATASGRILLVEECIIVELLLSNAEVFGALGIDLSTGETIHFNAKKTILATGGAGGLFGSHSDNMLSVTGDGYFLAYKAGARLRDMDLVQYLPFGLSYPASMTGIGCGEPAAAGPQGVLCSPDGELLHKNLNHRTRSQVVGLIADSIAQGKAGPNGGVLFDPRANLNSIEGKESYLRWRDLSTYDAVKVAYGPRAFAWEEPYEVLPTQHFFIGGVITDTYGYTGVSNLYAVGEVAGGLHGKDRLGSVALLECFVMGWRAGRQAVATLPKLEQDITSISEGLPSLEAYFKPEGKYSSIQLKNELAAIMWNHLGFSGPAEDLSECFSVIEDISARSEDLRISPICKYNSEIIHALELKALLLVAKSAVLSAMARAGKQSAEISIFPVVSKTLSGMKLEVEHIS